MEQESESPTRVDDTLLLGAFMGPLPGDKAKPRTQQTEPVCLLHMQVLKHG